MRNSLKLLGSIVIVLMMISSVSAQDKGNWKEFKTTHFIVLYQNAPKFFVEEVGDSAENSYRSIVGNLGFVRYQGWTYNDRVKIYIYDDANHYVKSANTYQWSHGIASPQDRVIRTYPAAHGFFDSTLPHELTHIIFREFIGFDVKLPLWFEEGVAMNQEKAKRWGSDLTVINAIKENKFIPIPELSNIRLNNRSSNEKVALLYTEGASIVSFMNVQFGSKRFERFCKELRDKTSFEMALRKVYVRIKSYEDLNKEWLEYLDKKY